MKNVARVLLACGLALLMRQVSLAQDSIPYVPSPMYVVHKMIEVAEIKKGDILYDMGSGDGRIVIEAAKNSVSAASASISIPSWSPRRRTMP